MRTHAHLNLVPKWLRYGVIGGIDLHPKGMNMCALYQSGGVVSMVNHQGRGWTRVWIRVSYSVRLGLGFRV